MRNHAVPNKRSMPLATSNTKVVQARIEKSRTFWSGLAFAAFSLSVTGCNSGATTDNTDNGATANTATTSVPKGIGFYNVDIVN